MKTEQVLKRLKINRSELARRLDCRPSTVTMWGDRDIPGARYLQLMMLYPDLFKAPKRRPS